MTRVFKPRPAPVTVADLERIPVALGVKDLARVFDTSIGTVYRWHHSGRLRQFELRRPMTAKRWSGALVAKFLSGDGNAIALLKARRSA